MQSWCLMGGLLKLRVPSPSHRGKNICIHRSENLTEGKTIERCLNGDARHCSKHLPFCLKPHGVTIYIQHTPFDATEIQFGLTHTPVCSGRTGRAAGPCWLSVSDPSRGRLQTQTPAPALLPPAGPPPPLRCSQIYSSPGPNQSPSPLHQEAPPYRAGLDPYRSPSQCRERTTNQRPLLLFTTNRLRQPGQFFSPCDKR